MNMPQEQANAVAIARIEATLAGQAREMERVVKAVGQVSSDVNEVRDTLSGHTSFFKGAKFALLAVGSLIAGAAAAGVNKILSFFGAGG